MQYQESNIANYQANYQNNYQHDNYYDFATQSMPSGVSYQYKYSENQKSYNIKKIVLISLGIVASLVLLTGIILIILFATIPCSMIKCHSKASKCINHAFRAQCICDDGYGGDGSKYCDECGLTFFEENARIVGGVESVQNSWPSAALVLFTYKATVYISSIETYVSLNQVYTCGGTLIDRQTVITAAHCIQSSVDFTYLGVAYTTPVKTSSNYPTIESMFKVYLGTHDKNSKTTYPSFESSVKKIHKHEEYSGSSMFNDIAILKLTNEATLNNFVQITCLPSSSSKVYPTQTNIVSWAIGWGTLTAGATSTADKLNNVKLTLYDGAQCNNVVSNKAKNWDSQICAGHLAGGKDTCQGDSGGSLFISDTVNGKTKFVSVGVVSYGNSCALPNLPGFK